MQALTQANGQLEARALELEQKVAQQARSAKEAALQAEIQLLEVRRVMLFF